MCPKSIKQCPNRSRIVPNTEYITTLIFYKQPVYKQLPLGRQIAKPLSGLNPRSLSSKKNYRLKKSGVFTL